jgi:hypothetical protein
VDDQLQNKLHTIDLDMTRVKNNLRRKNESEDEKINMKINIFDEMLVFEKILENL